MDAIRSPLGNNYYNNEKLKQLIESSIELQREETEQLRIYWDELIHDENKRIIVDSFTVVHPGDSRNQVRISFTFKHSIDARLWRQSILTGRSKLELKYGKITTSQNTVLVCLSEIDHVKKLLQFLKPLARKMSLQLLDFKHPSSEAAETCCDYFNVTDNKDLLIHDLMESVFENEKQLFEKIVCQWNQLKQNERHQMMLSITLERDKIKDRIQLSFYLNSADEAILWYSCINNAIQGISEAAFQCIFLNTVSVTIHAKDIGKVLNFLKPLSQISTYECATFRCIDHEIVRHCTAFTDGAPIPLVFIHTWGNQQSDNSVHIYEEVTEKEENIERNCWIEFVRKAEPRHTYVDLHDLRAHLYDFFVELAGFNRLMSLVASEHAVNSPPMPVSVVKRILAKKCCWLQLFDKNELTQENVEELLQFFHHCEKKKRLQSNIDTEFTHNQLGEYVASSYRNFGKRLYISHVNFAEDEEQ